jgi:hypothetical protein
MNLAFVLPRHTRIRLLAFAAFVGGAATIVPVGQSVRADEPQVQIEWRVPTPQLTDVQKRLVLPAQPAPSEDNSRGPPLFYLLAGGAALPSVVDAIISLYREVVYGGVVIDACTNRLEIHNDHSIPGKVMVVRCAEKLTPLYIGANVQSADLIKVLSNAMAHK